ncbi:hypothetical protein B2J88_48955 [Rhodococcus sp. SRB_17]|nr:hypothetical protein [Rhodococcus sp. SRB_17]
MPAPKRRPLSPCQTLPQVRERLRAGAKTVIIDHRRDTALELTDAELPDHVTVRITGISRVQITRTTPATKKSAQIVVTDAARVQIFGHTMLFAYGTATVDAFDNARVRATNRAVIHAVNDTYIEASEDTTVYAYDTATVHAHGHSSVYATDHTALFLYNDASAEVERGVAVHGPARNNITMRTN